MATPIAARRLQRELAALAREPVPHIVARPLEDNILEWHYVIAAAADTPYAGGHYHGRLRFPADYPLRPPAVLMLTPSGRFKTNRRLCLSMSDFHPESWNPMWSVATILTGLYSFMLEDAPTLGSVDATAAQRRELAARSLAFNVRDDQFRRLFPPDLFAAFIDVGHYTRELGRYLPLAKSLGKLSTDTRAKMVEALAVDGAAWGGTSHAAAKGLGQMRVLIQAVGAGASVVLTKALLDPAGRMRLWMGLKALAESAPQDGEENKLPALVTAMTWRKFGIFGFEGKSGTRS
mgnify:CR=1 FL=1